MRLVTFFRLTRNFPVLAELIRPLLRYITTDLGLVNPEKKGNTKKTFKGIIMMLVEL